MKPIVKHADELTTTRLVGVNMSEDGRFLTLTEERTIDLQAAELLAHEDEHYRQAHFISNIFGNYINYKTRTDLYTELVQLLNRGIIELLRNGDGLAIVNILKNTGQARFVRLILSHMTPQKRHALLFSQDFGTLKHLLMERLRHQGNTIHVNSISVTLKRAVTDSSWNY
jgi:hypothetical protein